MRGYMKNSYSPRIRMKFLPLISYEAGVWDRYGRLHAGRSGSFQG